MDQTSRMKLRPAPMRLIVPTLDEPIAGHRAGFGDASHIVRASRLLGDAPHLLRHSIPFAGFLAHTIRDRRGQSTASAPAARAVLDPGRISTLPASLLTIVAAFAGSDELDRTQAVLKAILHSAREEDDSQADDRLDEALQEQVSRHETLHQLASLNPRLFPYLPARLKNDYALALAFVQERDAVGPFLYWDREARIHQSCSRIELIGDALQQDAQAYRELALAAVSATPQSLEKVRPDMRDEKMCRAATRSAVERGRRVAGLLEAIPKTDAAWRAELIEDLVKSNPWYLMDIDIADCSQTLCEIGFARDPAMISFIPRQYITTRMLVRVARECPQKFDFLDVPVRDRRWLDLVRTDGLAIAFLTPSIRGRRDVCEAAVAQNPEAVRHIPERFHGEAFYRQARERLARLEAERPAQRAAYSGTSPWSQARTAPASGAGPAASIQPWTAARSSD